jgi:hypothetical protein
MKFKDIIKRITGISSPIFGVSWNPENSERDIAREVISYLEDRRVLYAPSEMENPEYCTRSILQIRHFLTSKIGILPEGSDLRKSLKAMRAACRKFLNITEGENEGNIIKFASNQGHWASWIFNSAVGELRGVFGIYLAKTAVSHGIDIENELATILPEEDHEELGRQVTHRK